MAAEALLQRATDQERAEGGTRARASTWTGIVIGAKPKDVGVCVQSQASRVMGVRLQPVAGLRLPFSLRAGATGGKLKRVAS